MPLPLIDFFANGALTIPIDYKQSISMETGCVEWLPIASVEVKNHLELAELAITHENYVEAFVNDFLTLEVMRPWRSPMGSRIPQALNRYQEKNEWTSAVDSEIHSIGVTLSAGQKLYRGGFTKQGMQSVGLSTTLSPTVAINEEFWKGRAQRQGKLQLYVLDVSCPKTNVYVFRQRGSRLGHEKEVLFASRANVGNMQVVRTGTMSTAQQELPYEIIEATIS